MTDFHASLSAALDRQAGDVGHVLTTHADPEEYARIFNEGYEAAMTQHLADDPSAADDWLAARLAEARAEERERVAAAIGARVRVAQDEVQGADFGSVLIATVNAYADACSDLIAARIARSEAGA